MKGFSSYFRQWVERYPFFASFFRLIRDHSRLFEEPLETPWGFKLVGNKLMSSGEFEPRETEVVRKALEDVDILINIGANIGYYCCHALSMGKRVVAFEPVQQNMNLLLKNMVLNGFKDFEAFPLALSDYAGAVSIYGGNTGASLNKGWGGVSDKYTSLVPVTTLDDVLGARFSGSDVLLVVDVEGSEKEVLRGAKNFISSGVNLTWLIEIVLADEKESRVDEEKKEIFNTFFSQGYRCYLVDENMREIQADILERIFDREEVLLGHNYLFTK